MKLSGRQLLVLLEIYDEPGGKVTDIGKLKNVSRLIPGYDMMEMEMLKLLTVGPCDVDQSLPVKLTRSGKRIAKAMVAAAEGALT